jgi:IPT/TIG domain-containing protein
MKRSHTLLSAIFIALMFLICLSSSAQSTIHTDKEDYSPGDTVFITGSGFQPGESVTLQVLHVDAAGDNDVSNAHAPWNTTADENGNISSTWMIPVDEDERGALLKLTADGERSWLHAETFFTDATNSLSPRAGTIAGGTSVTITGSSYPTGATFAVKFGNTSVPATRVNSTTLTAITPAHSAGSVNVTVVINGIDDVPLVNGYSYVCLGPSNAVFVESFGTVATTTAIAAHEAANGFDNDSYTMSGTGDIRTSSASTDYPGASGNANIFLTTTVGTNFQIAGINTTGLSNLELSFGVFKSAATGDGSDLIVEVSSDGVVYTALSFPVMPAGTGTAGWYHRTASGNIPAASNLRIRFRQNGVISQYRLDDIRLTSSPQIISQPASATKCVGEAVNFTVNALGTWLTYQWYKGSVVPGNEVGTNSNTLSINVVAASDDGTYYVVVNGSCSPATTSNAATLTVNTPPSITMHPGDESRCAGTPVSFTAASTAIPPPTVQWQVSTDAGLSYNDLPGETNTTLTFAAAGLQNSYKYRALFTNSCGFVTSNAATLTVNNVPSISINPKDETKCEGALVSFNAAVNENPAPGVQWQLSTDGGLTYIDLSGETNTTLSFTTATSQNGNKYRAAFTNNCGAAMTQPATLTILSPTTITDQRVNGASGTQIEIVYGCSTPVLSVVASGQGSLTYKWFKNSSNSNSGGTQVSTTSSSCYATPAAVSVGIYYYYVEVTGGCGAVKSNVFTLKVSPQKANAQNDGALYYTGPVNAWTPTATSNSATVTLAAFVKNSSEAGAACGDIATARVSFEVKNSLGLWSAVPGAQNLSVYYVDPANPAKGGTAAAIVQLNISNNTATQIFDLRVVVSGNYVGDPAYGCSQVTISRLVPGGAISGGVVLCGNTATGLLRPSAYIPTLLAFGVEYVVKQSKVQNPKGKVTVCVPSFYDLQGNSTAPQLNWYKITCNAIASLAITNPSATFTSKANVAKYNPSTGELTAIEGNCTMVLDLKDIVTTGCSNVQDLVGITVYRNAGGLWYSNNWSTSKTVPGNICGGDLTVTGTTSTSSTIAFADRAPGLAEQSVMVQTFQVKAYPNPTSNHFTLDVEGSSVADQVIIRVTDIAGNLAYVTSGAPQRNFTFGENLPAGAYLVEVVQGQTRRFLKVVKQ